jgi:protein-S-isoprenylcysteine O-methyltransferase Ste14
MTSLIGALTILLLMGMVLSRVVLLRRKGIQAMNFGKLDKTDFLIPPFALFYFYLVFARAFGWPLVSAQVFFDSQLLAWLGAACCLAGLLLLLWSLVSFGTSFRVGIDVDKPDQLVTTGVYGLSRNPIYVAFVTILLGEFLIFPNWILLVYLGAATWLIHRQVLREEDFMQKQYGEQYLAYSRHVRRYL